MAYVKAFVYGVIACVGLLVGIVLIYAFGSGYFGYVAIPTPLNFVVAPVLLVGWVYVLYRFVSGRIDADS